MPPRTRRGARQEATPPRARKARQEATPSRARSRSKEASISRRGKKARTPTPPPAPLPWPLATREQASRYKMLHKRKVVSSKFFDPYTIQHLGLLDEVTTLLNNIGWNNFGGIQLPTYKEITYEILSTLHANYDPHDRHDEPCIFFRCLGEDRAISMAQFNSMFGFPHEGITWLVPRFSADVAWNQLTGQDPEEYTPGQSKASCLRQHSLKYVHRVMVHSLFGRGLSTGVLGKVELLFLWAMVNNVKVNTGVWVLKHLLHVAANPTGRIVVGGVLTVIANAFGFIPDPDIYHVADGGYLVDVDTLINMRICKHIGGGQYRLLDDEGQVIHPAAGEAEEPQNEEEQMFQHEEEDMGEFHDPMHEPMHEEQQPDMHGFQEYPPPPQQYSQEDPYMTQLLERMERLETRMSSSEDIQRRILDATSRIEDKLANFK